MSDACSVDGGCSTCSFGQRLTALNADSGETWPVVLVRFRESSRTRFFAPGAVEARVNDWVVVDTGKGEEAGKVIATNQQVRAAVFAGPLKPVRRKAEGHEIALVERLEQEAKPAMQAFRNHIREHDLDMKPIRAEFSFDGKRLTFYYSSKSRVDFRDLVKDLAKYFGLRIDLRQVGERDEARLLGGVGKCGRSLCCSSWLQTYPSVTIKQAKEQDLPLNPTKISGVCGRLLCCLSYENEQYVELKRRLPRLGQMIPTPQGIGKVIGIQTLKGRVNVYLDGVGVAEFGIDELQTPPPAPRQTAPARDVAAVAPPKPAPAKPVAPVASEATAAAGDDDERDEPADPAEDGKRGRRSRRRGRRGGRRAGGAGPDEAGAS